MGPRTFQEEKHLLPLPGIEQRYLGRPPRDPVTKPTASLEWSIWRVPQCRTQYSPDKRRNMPKTVVHRNVRLSRISLPDRYPGLTPPACYVCNTGWGHSYTSLGLRQKKLSKSGFKAPLQTSTRYAWLRQAYRVATFQHPQSVKTTKTDDLLQHTEIREIMAWNPMYSMKTGNEMFQEIVVRNNLGNGTWTVGNKDNNVSKLWCHASSNMAYSGIL